MSQTAKVHKVQIKNRKHAEDKISVGANMEVLIDGQPLRGVTFFKFEVKAKGIAKVMLEMYAEVEIDANVELNHKSMEPTDLTMGKKSVALYQLGNYNPRGIATRLEPKSDIATELRQESSCNTGPLPFCGSCGCGKKEAYESKQAKASGGSEDSEG